MQPKVILQLYPMFPTKDENDRKAKRPLGRDSAMYQKIVHEWLDLLKSAEKMGVWGASTIEHHLHSEGYEVGPNPGILNAWWAGQLETMHVGALGYVMATQDPIRVAEETAILDHITKGKFFVGFARGYQSRWTNILGQFSDTVATVSDGSKGDMKNRDVFEERVDMLLKCWTEDTVSLDGDYYKAPYPLSGIKYPAYKIAAEAGGMGEIGSDGTVQKICVVPKPLQRPHPPIFVATSKSDDSIRYCARKGFRPTYFSNWKTMVAQSHIYVEEAAKHGRKMKLGERSNIVRWCHLGKDQADFASKLKKYDLDIYKNFYGPFFPQFPTDPNADVVKNMKESGIFIGGSVQDVADEWKRMYDEVPFEYITLIWHYAQQPKNEVLKELELFMTKVLPHLNAAVSKPDKAPAKPNRATAAAAE